MKLEKSGMGSRSMVRSDRSELVGVGVVVRRRGMMDLGTNEGPAVERYGRAQDFARMRHRAM